VYLNKKRIEPDKWTEIKMNDQICFGTPISKNSFRYTLEQLPDENYQLVRVGQQTPNGLKKKCEDGVSIITETIVATDTEPICGSNTIKNNDSTVETDTTVTALTETKKTESVAGNSSGTSDVSSDSMATSKTTEVEGSSSSNQMMFSMQEEFLCVICQELFINAHVLSCSHSFCQTCITDWLKKNNICPICRNKVEGKPIRSLVLDNAINRLVECMSEKDRNERAAVLKDRAPKLEENDVILITDSPVRRTRSNAVRVNVLDSSSDSNSDSNSDSSSDSELEESSPIDVDLDDYNGLPGYNWGGYGHCYRCGECCVLFVIMYLSSHDPSTGDPYHWAPGCPN